MPLKIEPILEACLANAGRLLESAKVVRTVPGCTHISFNLVVLSLEEIGKSILLFQEALELEHPPRAGGEDRRRPLEWIEDHERKLFWALWFGDAELNWRAIPENIDTARKLHFQRLRVLYYSPTQHDAQGEITEEYLSACLNLVEARLEMEKAKKFKELSEQDRSDIQWFFLATEDPQHKLFIFSKESLEKQAEFGGGPEWLKWIRDSIEKSQRSAYEVAEREMARKQAEEGDRHEDKWKMRIRLKSWSHSIRQNQLLKWNENIRGIKLYKGAEHNDLTVDFIVPKSITVHQLWNLGMHHNVIFASSLNIASLGFFWWYLPQFTSRYHDSITDLENNHSVVLDRVPELKIVWPQQALKYDMLEQNLGIVFGFVVRSREQHMAVYHKYFGTLGLMAKNDLFYQFEHHLVQNFIECLEMALKSYGDWDGSPSTFESVIAGLIPDKEEKDGFISMVLDLVRIAREVEQRNLKEVVTLEHAIKAKIAFDTYIQIKARASYIAQIKGRNEPES
jgi:AbiV family abortive infection protein